jgi:peptidoglycan hydrolase-like protein with peptidoglycan-binding domain
MSILKRGVSGEPVKLLQQKLGITADGSFGPGTEKALKEAQAKHGIAADGIAGPDTFMKLGLPELILLRVGTHGEAVKTLQLALGIAADGKFGPATAAAVKAFQEKNGLDADGMAGPDTLARMSAFAGTMTPEVVKRAEVTIELPDMVPLPPLTSGDIAKPGTVAASAGAPDGAEAKPPKKSVWGTVKGWFG